MLSLFPSVFPAQGPLRGSVFSTWIGFGCFLGRDALRACLWWLRPPTASLVFLAVGLKGRVGGLFLTPNSPRCACPYHCRHASHIFFSIGATPSHFRTSSFITQSRRVKPTVHLRIFISMALRICSCFLVVGQQSHRATGHMTLL